MFKFGLKFHWSLFPRVQRTVVQIMAWRRPGDKPLSDPMVVSLETHICVTWLQWVKYMPISLKVHQYSETIGGLAFLCCLILDEFSPCWVTPVLCKRRVLVVNHLFVVVVLCISNRSQYPQCDQRLAPLWPRCLIWYERDRLTMQLDLPESKV